MMATNMMDGQVLHLKAPYTSSRKTWVVKLYFRIVSLVCSTAVIGLFGYIVSYPEGNRAALALVLLGAPATFSWAWSFAECICLWVRGGNKGIDVGAIVGCDLILWMGLLGTTIAAGLFRDGFYSEYSPEDYWKTRRSQEAIVIAAIVLTAINIILHFALFLIGCQEVSARNKMPLVVYVRSDAFPPAYVSQEVGMKTVSGA